MYEVSIVIFLLVCAAMVALILVQQGKGAGMGASFGAGASNTVFGSVGSGNFLTRTTWVLIIVFFGICLFIGWMQKTAHEQTSNFSDLGTGQTTEAPAAAGSTGVVPPAPLPEDVPVVNTDVPAVEEVPAGTVAPAAAPAVAASEAATPSVSGSAAGPAASGAAAAAPSLTEVPAVTEVPMVTETPSAAATITPEAAAAASSASAGTAADTTTGELPPVD